MSLNPSLSTTGNTLYFGPLSGYDTEELDRRGLDQDKKTLKGYEWFSSKDSNSTPTTIETIPFKKGASVSENKHSHQDQGSEKDSEDRPTWDHFTQRTTFHGIRYIFDQTPFRLRR